MLLEDIIQIIINGGFAKKKDTDIFKDYAPETPDDCVVVYEYTSSSLAPLTSTCVRSIQIVVRGKKSKDIIPRINGIFKLFHSEDELIMEIGKRTCIINNRNTPIKIGVDDPGRKLYAFNLGITSTID